LATPLVWKFGTVLFVAMLARFASPVADPASITKVATRSPVDEGVQARLTTPP
jgi:hypothetical protein